MLLVFALNFPVCLKIRLIATWLSGINKWFVRFSVKQVDEDSRKPQGVFGAAYALLDYGDLELNEREQLRTILEWFSEHLPSPPEDFYASRAIFWFKSNYPRTRTEK